MEALRACRAKPPVQGRGRRTGLAAIEWFRLSDPEPAAAISWEAGLYFLHLACRSDAAVMVGWLRRPTG